MKKANVERMSRRLKAIADPTRIKIITLLSQRPCCVCELVQVLGLSQPTVSRHLKQLETEGFVTGRRQKNWMIYRLSAREECCRQLLGILINRARQDQEVLKLMKRLENTSRQAEMDLVPQAAAGGACK